jgi:hypothetical protein
LIVDGNVRAMVKVDVRSMAFANDPNITPRVYLVVMQMKIGSDSTFNGGSVGCTVVCAAGSLTQVALTGFGYLY